MGMLEETTESVLSFTWILDFYVATNESEMGKPLSLSVTSEVATAAAAPVNEFHAVLDTGQTKRPKTPLLLSGPELASRLKMGTRVVRGLDWKWGDQVASLSFAACVFLFHLKCTELTDRYYLHLSELSKDVFWSS